MVVQGSDLVGPTEAKNPTPLARQRKMSNLWDQAFENLRHGDRKLPESYARVLRGIETPESACRDQQMLAIINQRLEQMKSRQWKIKLAGTSFRIREQIDRIVRVVSVIRDLGNSGAALDPVHAGLAWAGVCVLLSVIVNQSEAREAATAGIEKIAILIPRYKQVEAIYLENESDHSAKIQLRNAIVNLYSKILEYQIELARYLEKGAFKRISSFARDALKLDDWKDKMQKIHDSDDNCRASMAVYGAALTNITQETLRKMLTQLDEKVNRGIADIITSHSVVEWNPGPNTDPGYVSVLYGGVQGRAGSFRISLADIKNDEQLFVQMRAVYAKRQHRLWRRELPHPWESLAWLTWFDVKRIEYVKYTTLCASKASYGRTHDSPIPKLLPPDVRLFAWNHPLETDSQDCLTELCDVLASSQRWGILIIEGFDIVKFSFSMMITIGLSLLIGMVADDFGRTTGGSLRTSFIIMLASVLLLGVLPNPAMTDVIRDKLTTRRILVVFFCLLVAAMTGVFTYMMSVTLRRSLNALGVILLFVGLFYEKGQ